MAFFMFYVLKERGLIGTGCPNQASFRKLQYIRRSLILLRYVEPCLIEIKLKNACFLILCDRIVILIVQYSPSFAAGILRKGLRKLRSPKCNNLT
jgi:hypothetical protein